MANPYDPNRHTEYERRTRVEQEENVPPEEAPPAVEPGYDSGRTTRVEEERVEKVPGPRYDNVVRRTEVTERRTGPRSPVPELIRASQIIWFLTGVLEALIGIRFLLRLLAANPNAGFAQLIYGITAPFLAPFAGLTVTPSADGAVLEISSLVAMLVYALLAWGVIRLLWLIFAPRPPVE